MSSYAYEVASPSVAVRVELTNTFTVCSNCSQPFKVQLRRMQAAGTQLEVRNQPQCSECR